MNTKFEILKKLYKSYIELEEAIKVLPTEYERGYAFEDFSKAYCTILKDKLQIKEFYMRNEIPEKYLEQLKLESTDHGVDALIVEWDGSLIAVQMKFRSDNSNLTYRDLSTFWTEADDADGCLTFTNSTNIPKAAQNRRVPQRSITLSDLLDLDETFFEQMYEYFNFNNVVSKREYHHRKEHQIKMIDDVLDQLKYHQRGKILAACGTGKTVVSKWLHDDLASKVTIFFAPSLALIKQTIESWTSNTEKKFMYMAVCSDQTVISSDENDSVDFHSHEMSFTVSTSPEMIIDFLTVETNVPKVIFCTYQSADAVANAIDKVKESQEFSFDLGLFDESHRASGVGENAMFTIALEDSNIPIKKRIFLTATERVVSKALKEKYEQTGATVYSMDNSEQYGPTFHSYNFGQAISEGVIAKYKMVVCTIAEDEVGDLLQQYFGKVNIDSSGEEREATVEQILLKVIMAKAYDELGITKTVAYLNRVSAAKRFVSEHSNDVSLTDVFSQVAPQIAEHDLYVNAVDGTMSAKDRKIIMDRFAAAAYGVLANAKVLSEGVDIPEIDAVFFANPKTSSVDIIQAIGRALRKKPGVDKTAYIILPVIIPSGVETFSGINAEAFETIHKVIAALADQDSDLKDIIEEVNYENSRRTNFGSTRSTRLPMTHIPVGKLSIPNFSEALEFRIGDVNSRTAEEKIQLKALTSGSRRSKITRSITSISDYKAEAMFTSLIKPTLQIFMDKGVEQLTSAEIKINNNNVSHTYRLGAIEKGPKRTYVITQLGKDILAGKVTDEEVFKLQMLRYHILDKETEEMIFPYRAFLKVLLGVPYIRKIDFIFGLYIMHSTNHEAIEKAIDTINYLQETYPYEEQLSVRNKELVLDRLNARFNTELGFMDVWTSRGSTYNQFNYFVKHLLHFESFVEYDKNTATLQIEPSQRMAVMALLTQHEYLEELAAEGKFEQLRKEYTIF